MKKKIVVCTIMMALVVVMLSLGSCKKLSDTQLGAEGTLKMDIAQLGDDIPLAWGKVISVSSINQFPGWVQVWFQDKDGTIYMIPYHIESNTFHATYRQLKRK